MRVTDLWLYPVKSLGGAPVERAEVEPWGLVGDRRWGVVDEAGLPVTAREVHAMLGVTATQVDEETIRLTARDGDSILVETPLGVPVVPVGFSRQAFAPPADADVSEWLSDQVGQRVRLVWQEHPTARPISGAHGGRPGEHVSLADTGPLLLTTESSMARLNEWLALADEPALPITRFRPNVVVDGGAPFAEDGWPGVRIGDVDYRTTELCDRCVMTTIDTATLRSGKEPIRTLARYRKWDGATWFGIRLVPESLGEERTGGRAGVIAVGDEVVPRSA